MIAIRDMLNQIQWDPSFAGSSYELAIYDRIEDCLIRIPYGELEFEEGNHFAVFLHREDENPITIPLHRVREVYRDGVCIWRRPS